MPSADPAIHRSGNWNLRLNAGHAALRTTGSHDTVDTNSRDSGMCRRSFECVEILAMVEVSTHNNFTPNEACGGRKRYGNTPYVGCIRTMMRAGYGRDTFNDRARDVQPAEECRSLQKS